MIKYPKGEGFSYKYSLDDGKSWKDASITESLDVSGNVIATCFWKMESIKCLKLIIKK